MQDSNKTEVLTDERLTVEINRRLSKLPAYNPENLDSVFNRAECYASTVRLADSADFERWVKKKYYKSSPEYFVVPLQDPPISNGMVDCFRRLDEILVPRDRSSVPSPGQLNQVSGLLQRIQDLITIYYTYQVFEQNSNELHYCDVEHPATISYHLSRLGQILMLHPTFITRLFRESPDFRLTILQTLKPDIYQTGALHDYHGMRSRRSPDRLYRPTGEEKEDAFTAWQLLHSHRGFHQWLHLIAPIWLRIAEDLPFDHFLSRSPIITSMGSVDRSQLSDAVTDFHIIHTSTATNWATNGDAALNAILVCPFHEGDLKDGKGDKFLKRWLGNGEFGMVTFLLGSFTSFSPTRFLQLLQRSLIHHKWVCPSRKVADEILSILNHTFDKAAELETTGMRPIIIMLLHNIFMKFGPKPFEKAAQQSFYSSRMSFFAKRLSKHQSKYQDERNFLCLWRKYELLPAASKARYDMLLPNAWEVFDNLSSMGCEYEQCSNKGQIKQLMLTCEREGNMNSEDIYRRLEHWRKRLKICGCCSQVMYCSRECQKADWPKHNQNVHKTNQPLNQSYVF